MTDRERLIQEIEFQLEKARYGLALPYCAEDVRHYEALLKQAKGSKDDD